MKEHHGLDINPATVARITLKQAKRAKQLVETAPVSKYTGKNNTPIIVPTFLGHRPAFLN